MATISVVAHRLGRRPFLQQVRLEQVDVGDAQPVGPVVDDAEHQDDLRQHHRGPLKDLHQPGVQRGVDIHHGSHEDVDGQEEQGAQPGDAVQQERQKTLFRPYRRIP